MSIYANTNKQKRDRWDEVGVDIRWVSGPDYTTTNWPVVWLYYVAMQIDFVASDGYTIQGGGHIGLQVYDNDTVLPHNMTFVNWGCYDNTITPPGGGNAQFRQSQVLEPDTFVDINNNVTMGMDWSYGEWLRFRVFKSPEQAWAANEIKPGENQVAPYIGTDQQADEVAYRCTIQNLTRGTPPVGFHDILVKSPASSKPITNGSCWLEAIQKSGSTGDIDVDWPDSPEVHFRNIIHDGARNVTEFRANYYAGDPGGVPNGPAANCDCRMVAGTPGYISMLGPVTRTNADGSLLAPPSGLWDDPQPNVAPAPTDLSPRISTRRPWF